MEADRRHAQLALTAQGQDVFQRLEDDARAFDAKIRKVMSEEEAAILHRCLVRIADLPEGAQGRANSGETD